MEYCPYSEKGETLSKYSDLVKVIENEIENTGRWEKFQARKCDAGLLAEATLTKPWKRFNISSSDVVLDIGSHIGTFARFAVDKGATVISIEAHPESCELFKINVPEATLLEGFAHTGSDESKKFCVCDKDPCLSSGYRKRGRVIEVPVVDFQKVLEKYPFTVLKMDVEGGEYNLLSPLPNMRKIQQIGVEFHPRGYAHSIGEFPLQQYRDRVDGIFKDIHNAGFKMLRKCPPKVWFKYAIEVFWEREKE